MVFFRNVQARWMPIQGDTRLTLAVERPGASGDAGLLADRIELQNVKGRIAAARLQRRIPLGGKRGYFEVAGLLGQMKWDDQLDDAFDLSGSATRWGVNFSSNVKLGSATTIRLQWVTGEGIQNYMNDAPVDVGIVRNPGNATRPIEGEAIPLTASVIFVDHNWSPMWSSSIGYSRTDTDNLEGQADDAFNTAQYALANLLYTPVGGGDDGRRVAVGAPRELPRSLRRRRIQGAVLVQIQLLRNLWRQLVMSIARALRCAPAVFTAVVALAFPSTSMAQTPAEIEAALKAAFAKYQNLKEGKNADYIPALAKVDPNLFGIALVTPDGKVYTAGNVKTEVSIQSISKVFTMAQVMQEQGADAIAKTHRRRCHRRALQLDHRHRGREDGGGDRRP